MQLTEKQLKVQQWADKTLSFGCITKYGIYLGKWYEWWWPNSMWYTHKEEWDTRNIDYPRCSLDNCSHLEEYRIWHPMDYSRVLYLWLISWLKDKLSFEFSKMMDYIEENIIVLNQTVLERPEEFIDLVIAFLETLPKVNNEH